ncbi:MAG: glycosyltransferase family 1 protein [Chloroflexi bacterium HGW-Chloroflexi-10]|nr:MAG: glycosyltransferase family 1 protein [Chloroflexi bacterium HGW-Chloroflexi-10]
MIRKRILLDATALPKKPVGAGKYICKIIPEILKISSEHEIFILAHPDDFDLFSLPDEYRNRFLFTKDLGRGLRIFAEQFYYPYLIKKYNIDLFHGLHYSIPIIASCKTISTIHDMTFFLFPKKHLWIKKIYFRFFIRYSSKYADKIIAISDSTKKDLLRILKGDPLKIVTVPLAVDPSFHKIGTDHQLSSVRQKYQLPEKFILFVGLIEPRKNVGLLIRSFAAFRKENNDETHLVIAGRWGWESEAILNLVKNLKLSEFVHFPGYIEQIDMPYIYNLATLFIYPSIYEGFGLPVLEAMASGTPVITSNISSMPEFVGDAGVLIEPDNQDDLTSAIHHLLIHDEFRKEMSEKAILQAKQYTWTNTATKTMKIYSELLDE